MSAFKLLKASALLLTLTFHGCGKQDAESDKKLPVPKRKLNRQVGVRESSSDSSPEKSRAPSREKVLSQSRAKLQDYIKEAEEEMLSMQGPGLNFASVSKETTLNDPFEVDSSERLSDIILDKSAVFGGQWSEPDMHVIKYRTNCGSGEENALVRNYVFMQAIRRIEADSFEQIRLTPTPQYLSGAAALTKGFEGEFVKGIQSPTNFGKCIGSDYRFMIMDRMVGSLRAFVEQNGPVPLATALNWLGMVIQALQPLHEHGMVHAGVHLDNVLLTKSGSLVLTDFDQARLVEGNSRWTKSAKDGASPYAEFHSPRQLRDISLEPVYADDIYSAYEMAGALMKGPDFYTLLTAGDFAQRLATKKSLWLVTDENSKLHTNLAANDAVARFHDAVHSALTSPNAVPDHQALIKLLNTMIKNIS